MSFFWVPVAFVFLKNNILVGIWLQNFYIYICIIHFSMETIGNVRHFFGCLWPSCFWKRSKLYVLLENDIRIGLRGLVKELEIFLWKKSPNFMYFSKTALESLVYRARFGAKLITWFGKAIRNSLWVIDLQRTCTEYLLQLFRDS